MQKTEYQVLIALAARKLEMSIRESLRDHGDIIKFMGANPKDMGLLALDIIEEATKLLRARARQAEEKGQ